MPEIESTSHHFNIKGKNDYIEENKMSTFIYLPAMSDTISAKTTFKNILI